MSGAPWYRSVPMRIVVGVLAVALAGYALVVPAALLYLTIGSRECFGPLCTTATTVAVVGGGTGVIVGLGTAVVALLFALRPGRALLLITAVGVGVLIGALLAQTWGTRTLSDGRARGAEAAQLSYDIDRSMQEALLSVLGNPAFQLLGPLGPEFGLTPCDLPAGPGFRASSRLTFTGSSSLAQSDRDGVAQAFTQSRERMILIPATVDLVQRWEAVDGAWTWTVTASCQPLPEPAPQG